MSAPLRDFRLGITDSIDNWLYAVAASRGADKAAVAREILQTWADMKQREHAIATGLLRGDCPAEKGGRR